jgi:hypothetical protein
MNSHAFLSEDMKMEEVVYGNKYRMIANFDNQVRSVDGKEIQPFNYFTEC